MQLRRKAIDRKIVRDQVVRKGAAGGDGPLAGAGGIPSGADVRPIVVCIGFRLSEYQADSRVVSNGVQRLFSLVAGNSGPFVAQSKVESQARPDLPIILHERIDSRIVESRSTCTRASKRTIAAVGNQVIDERIERFIVPFATSTRQTVILCDVVPPFDSHLEGVLSTNVTHIVDQLIDVLNVALGR